MLLEYQRQFRRAVYILAAVFLLSSCTIIISANNKYVILNHSDSSSKSSLFSDKRNSALKNKKNKTLKGSLNALPAPPVKIENEDFSMQANTNTKTCPAFVLPKLQKVPAAPIEELNKIAPNATKQLDDILLSYIRQLVSLSNTNEEAITKAYTEYIKKCESIK